MHHATTYRSPHPVTMGYHRAHLAPRDTPGQRVLSHRLDVAPVPTDRADHVDIYGNRFTYFCVEEPHEVFEVVATSEIEILKRRPLADPSADWESAAAQAEADPLLADFTNASPLVARVDGIDDYAARSFEPGRPLLEALTDLTRRIFRDFAYRPGWSTVSTPVADVLASRQGVCQDFAHLALACARSVGLAARYVSGYIESAPPEGRPSLVGADASHAWASVRDASGMWIDIDPTNDLVEPVAHLTVAWGRDYSDVVPLQGVVTSVGGPSHMTVAVDVSRRSAGPERRTRHHDGGTGGDADPAADSAPDRGADDTADREAPDSAA